jgi:hypothetical protein
MQYLAAAGITVASLAAIVPAHATTTGTVVKLCDHGYIVYGATRIRDNAWAGYSGSHPYCIRTNGVRTEVLTNAVPAGNVVAYPSSETGPGWLWQDRASGMPAPVTQLNQLTYNVGAYPGSSAGVQLYDVDMQLISYPGYTGHMTGEIVVANRWTTGRAASGHLIRVHGTWYRFRHWITTDGTYRWPIYVFRQVTQTATAHVMLGKFTYQLLRRGLLNKNERWLRNAAYGPEIWSGGKYLVFTKTISNPLPPLAPLNCITLPATC